MVAGTRFWRSFLTGLALAFTTVLTNSSCGYALKPGRYDGDRFGWVYLSMKKADKTILVTELDKIAIAGLYSRRNGHEPIYLTREEVREFLSHEVCKRLLVVEFDPEKIATEDRALELMHELDDFITALGYRRTMVFGLDSEGCFVLKDQRRSSRKKH
jgi:hypothetical protein